jgi:hypothetical protein
MPGRLPDDRSIDELLRLARASMADSAARRWIRDALVAAQAIAARERRPPPATHNAPLDRIERCTDQLISAIDELRRHPDAHGTFWSFAALGPICASTFERPDVMSALNNIRQAARNARVSRTGRPPDVRKQRIVGLALAFCARFSTARPSADVNNFFPLFAERFFEYSTGSSIEHRGRGIGRQITVALRRLPIERERATLLNENLPRIA